MTENTEIKHNIIRFTVQPLSFAVKHSGDYDPGYLKTHRRFIIGETRSHYDDTELKLNEFEYKEISDPSKAKYITCMVIYTITLITFALAHWGRDKMAAVSQTTLSNAFSWMKMLEFRLRFHWSLFLKWLIYWRIYASLGLNELTTSFE